MQCCENDNRRVGAAPLAIAAAVAKAAPILIGFFNSVFGVNKWQHTTGVRWLIAYYQYYVLGDASATSSNRVNEQYITDAQTWFSVVLGVPIYDRYRLHALMGTNPADGAPLGQSDELRVQSYLRSEWVDTQGQDPARVLRAVQIAKQFRWGSMPGSWAVYGVPADPVEELSETPGGGGLTNLLGSGSGSNWPLIGGAALLLIGLYYMYDGDT